MPPPILHRLSAAWNALTGREPELKAARGGPGGSATGPIPVGGAFGYGVGGGVSTVLLGGFADVPGGPNAVEVPFYLNSVVMAGLAWLARNFPVPDLRVVHSAGADKDKPIDDHPLVALFDRPNELHDFYGFFALSVLSHIVEGNTFWLKRKDGKGSIVDLWWLNPWCVSVIPDRSGQRAVSGYYYQNGGVRATYDPDEIVHVKNLEDPNNPYRGMTPLVGVRNAIAVVDRSELHDLAVVTNGGTASYMIAPADGGTISKNDTEAIGAWWAARQTGKNAGKPFVAQGALAASKIGFSPEEMALDNLPIRYAAKILAPIGLNPMALGYPDPNKTYSNLEESKRSAGENGLMPVQGRFVESINRYMPELVGDGQRAGWDYSKVPYLQENREAKIHSLVEAVGGGIFTVDEARADLGYEPMPEEEKPEPPQPPPAPGADGADGAADGAADGSAAPAGIAALLAARGNGNGNGNGKVSAGATGNGKPARPAAKALTGPADPPTDAELARRTEAVLVALEVKLRGGRSRKANPHHDHSGRFAHGSGGGSGHAGLTAEGKPRVYGFDSDVARSMVAELDEEAGGKHTLEFAHPETIRDRQALAKADAAGRPVAVRVTQAPEVEVRRGGDATEYLVGGEPHYTVRPHPDDDFTFRTRAKAEAHAEGAVAKEVRVSTETAYATPRRLSNLDFVKYASAPGYRTNFHVLIPEGEPLPGRTKGADRAGAGPQAGPVVIDGIEVPMSRDGAGGPPADPFDLGPAIARIKALYRSGQLTRSAAVLAIKAVRRGACRDRRGRFASCGTGAATSQDIRHERDTRPGGTRAARELVTGAGEHAGAGTPKPKPGPKPEPPRTPLEAGKAAVADAMAKQREAAATANLVLGRLAHEDRRAVIPHVVPGANIKERLDGYKVGDAKIEHALKVADHHDAKIKELDIRDPDLRRMTVKAIERERNAEVLQLLAPPQPTRVDLTTPKGLTDSKGKKLVDPNTSRQTAAHVKEGSDFVGSLLHSPDGSPLATNIGVGKVDSRAHFASGPKGEYIRIAPFEDAETVAHELGHAIENKVITAGVPLKVRSQEFLKHRIGSEQPRPLNQVVKERGYRDDEMGAKDKFDRAFGEDSAWYVGKHYRSGDTEILSMGIEALHKDPINFMRKDPEYAKLVLGLLDGSLR